MRKFLPLFALLALAGLTRQANAQATIVYDPVVVGSYPVVSAPVLYEAYRPIVSAPVVTTYRPVRVYRPITVYDPVVGDLPVATYPVTTYRPVVTSYSPVVTYSAPVLYDPVVTSYYAPVVVRSKVFVAGQPVRNFFRAIGP
jgi:hypothetical protein